MNMIKMLRRQNSLSIKISSISIKFHWLWVVRNRIIEGNFWKRLWWSKMRGKPRQKLASSHYKKSNSLVIKEHKRKSKKKRRLTKKEIIYKIWSIWISSLNFNKSWTLNKKRSIFDFETVFYIFYMRWIYYFNLFVTYFVSELRYVDFTTHKRPEKVW